MEFKKCTRCGSFYITNTAFCGNCLSKENSEISRLESYFKINEGSVPSIEYLSLETGITIKNLNRQLQEHDFGVGL
ncbi:MAG: hypothetical protein FWF46_03295 [Oscillospiraceae bacterium]|nr:hypothetical protein [Oscillospiraceae bacterium]